MKNLTHPSWRLHGAALAILLFCCAGAGASTAADTLLVQEAVIRYQVSDRESWKDEVEVFCIKVKGDTGKGETAARLVERLADGRRKIRKASACGTDKYGRAIEKRSRRPALFLEVGKITWHSSTRASVESESYQASRDAAGASYRVEKRDGAWVVVEEKIKWEA